ncbi:MULTISPECIES: CBS domain-containing protein [Streptomyces]|uniref:CBS domain-containing protein n=1 Tax=Streptomyces TaxID=1883 RepID=UPI0004C69DA1|nr:CBS domain-containing protein [Streptomyces sp. KS_5]SEE72154.1 CBS domain-containing protein [Streptomyces sp. KS_5]
MHGTPNVVSDVMTRTVVAVERGATFKNIVKAMHRWNVSALPVVDEGQRVLGIVSQADLMLKEALRDGDVGRPAGLGLLSDPAKAEARTAEELMTTPAITADEDDTLARAARTMSYYGVKRLPVIDDQGVLKGIVGPSDVLKVFLRDDGDIAEEVRREVVALLFPEVLEGIRVGVRDGVVRLTGQVPDNTLIPVAVRLAGAVEGVVGVDCELLGPRRRPVLDPDPPEDRAVERPSGTVESP